MGEFDTYIEAHRARQREHERILIQRAAQARGAADAAARRIAGRFPVRRVLLYGSLARGRFDDRSDIDLVVEGLPAGRFIDALVEASRGCPFEVDLVPLEQTDEATRSAVESEGVVLWPR